MLQQDNFQCYQYYKQPESLTKSLLKWIILHFSLLIFYLPISIFLFVSLLFSICFITQRDMPIVVNGMKKSINKQNLNKDSHNKCYKCGQRVLLLFNPCILYLFTASTLLILYLIDINYDIIHHLHIEEAFTLTPYVLFILFKDAVVYSLNMRMILLKCIKLFDSSVCCQKIYIWWFKWILRHYFIWGQVKIYPHKQPSISNNNSNIPYVNKFISLDFRLNLCRLHHIYGGDEYFLFLISTIFGVLFVLSSFTYFLLQNHNLNTIFLWILFGVGIIFKIFTVLCVARWIESIFQGFQIYYNHMGQLCNEIEFKPNNYDPEIKKHYHQLQFKQYTDIKHDKYYNKQSNDDRKYNIDDNIDEDREQSFSQRTSLIISSLHEMDNNDKKIEANDNNLNYGKLVDDGNECACIKLYDQNQCVIWNENWCSIEKLSSLYFHNRQSIVFAIITCTLIGITALFYQIFVWDTLIDEFNLSCFCGLLYVIIVVLRFIIWGIKFSKLETKHIRLLRTQKMYILHRIIILQQHKKRNINKIGEYNAICKYLDGIIDHIKDRSLCPKIAGLTLNKAFVNLTITSIIGYIFAFILYRLRKDYVQEN